MLPTFSDRGLLPSSPPTVPKPISFTHKAALYQLRMWSEREWSSIPLGSRPHAEQIPGLGWVGGELIEVLN
jgi:hypothetical protein